MRLFGEFVANCQKNELLLHKVCGWNRNKNIFNRDYSADIWQWRQISPILCCTVVATESRIAGAHNIYGRRWETINKFKLRTSFSLARCCVELREVVGGWRIGVNNFVQIFLLILLFTSQGDVLRVLEWEKSNWLVVIVVVELYK